MFEIPVKEWVASKSAEGVPSEPTVDKELILSLQKVVSQVIRWRMVNIGCFLGFLE